MHLDAHMGYNPLHILKIEIQLFEWTDRPSSLLSGSRLSVGFVISSLGSVLLLGRHSLGQIFLFGFWFPVWVSVFLPGRYVLNESSLWGKSSLTDLDLLFGCQSSSWESILIISLLCGASLPVGFLISCLGVILPVGKKFLNESSFWGRSFCWVCDFLFGCQSSCREDILLISLLSGSGLSVGFVISCLGVGLPVGKTFS